MGRLFDLHSAKILYTANVELWVVLTTLLLVVKFAIDASGPWYFNKFMTIIVRFLEGLNNSMVHYTLGVMQLSPTKNDFFMVWAVLMVTLRYSVKVGRPYGRSKKLTLSDMLSSLWTANLLRSKASTLLMSIPLWLIWCLNALRIIAYFVCSERASRIKEENLRLVTDYMSYEHELSDSAAEANPVTMSGYKYLVYGEDEQEKKVKAPDFRFHLDARHRKLITTERVWSLHSDRLLGEQEDTNSQFKDVCLSFALYKLLRRRFYKLPSHEVTVAEKKTRKLIIDGVLQGEHDSDYERVFRITEVELSFLRDSFHGNHAVMFVNGFPFRRLALSVFLIAALLFVGYHVYFIPIRTTENKSLRKVTHAVPVSYGIIFLISVKELCEIYVYAFSQWTKLWILCTYITVPKRWCSLMRWAVKLMLRSVSRGQWDQKLGQYNILIQSSRVKHRSTSLLLDMMRPTSIKLQTEVKMEIFKSLKGLQSPQSLGSYFSDAFRSNEVRIEQFSWANALELDTHRILVWHIATCLCEIQLCGKVAAATALKSIPLRPRLFVPRSREISEAIWGHYVIAVTLSNYCAYLLTRLPRLVPDNGYTSSKMFHAVKNEVKWATSRCKSLQDIHDRLMGKISELDGKDEATVKMGAELARQLLETYQDDGGADAWQVLANFWTGFLLHLAASTKPARHKKHLQGRGELITHLWALLSHAGFHGTTIDDESSEPEVDDYEHTHY